MTISSFFCKTEEIKLMFFSIWMLLTMYFLTPASYKHLIGANERILYVLIFIAPICITANTRFILLEKLLVTATCIIVTLFSHNYFSRYSRYVTPTLEAGRELINQIPDNKKLISLNAISPYMKRVSPFVHISSYYLYDKTGFTPGLFSLPYMIVQYKTRNSKTTNNLDDISTTEISTYDYVLIWGDSPECEQKMENLTFRLVDRKMRFGLYARTLAD
jgi:hypothetical protein